MNAQVTQNRSPNSSRSGLWTRRNFLKVGTATAAGIAMAWRGPSNSFAAEASPDPFSFFVISDTHYQAQRDNPATLIPDRGEMNERLIKTLNDLPGQTLPRDLGGGKILPPKGVIHLGDMVDSGDKPGSLAQTMTDTEWKRYVEDFGLTGSDGKLHYPLYEMHGNHDSPRQLNAPLRGIMERNTRRPGLTHVSDNGLHYSWDWGGIHFMALGLLVGPNANDLPISRYDSYQSLPFLVADLEKNVGDSGRPVILLHHMDLQRYSGGCDSGAAGLDRSICCEGMAKVAWCSADCQGRSPGITMPAEWSPCDVAAFHHALRPYNVAAIFHGHLHGRRTDKWNGQRVDAEHNIPVFGCDNSGAGGNRAFFYCCVEGSQLVVREYQSLGHHGWDHERADIQWTPQLWKVPL